MAENAIAYDRRELNSIIRALKAMDEKAVTEAQQIGGKLAEYAANEVKKQAYSASFPPIC